MVSIGKLKKGLNWLGILTSSCITELVITTLEGVPVFAPDLRTVGRRSKIRRSVLTTLTVMVISVPSASSNVFLKTPAFATTTSNRSKVSHFAAKAWTELALDMSISHTSTTPLRPVDCSMEALASSPLFKDLTARITRVASRRTK